MSQLSTLQKIINKLVAKRNAATDPTVRASLTAQIRQLESTRIDLLIDKATPKK